MFSLLKFKLQLFQDQKTLRAEHICHMALVFQIENKLEVNPGEKSEFSTSPAKEGIRILTHCVCVSD